MTWLTSHVDEYQGAGGLELNRPPEESCYQWVLPHQCAHVSLKLLNELCLLYDIVCWHWTALRGNQVWRSKGLKGKGTKAPSSTPAIPQSPCMGLQRFSGVSPGLVEHFNNTLWKSSVAVFPRHTKQLEVGVLWGLGGDAHPGGPWRMFCVLGGSAGLFTSMA